MNIQILIIPYDMSRLNNTNVHLFLLILPVSENRLNYRCHCSFLKFNPTLMEQAVGMRWLLHVSGKYSYLPSILGESCIAKFVNILD
jgi:hypothetical protein